MAPVFYGLEAVDVEEVTGVPTELSRMLLDGEIDIAPIPSIEYARNADRLRILPARLRLVRGCRRLDPARHAVAVRAGPVGRGDPRERDLGRPHAHPAPEGRDPPARDGGGRDPPDRGRCAAQRVRGPDTALRPRPTLAREDRAADGLRGLGGARAARRRPRRARARSRRVGSPGALGAGAPRAQGERDVRLSGGLPRALLREAPLQLRPARARRASTPSSRWPATSVRSTTCPSSGSSARRCAA